MRVNLLRKSPSEVTRNVLDSEEEHIILRGWRTFRIEEALVDSKADTLLVGHYGNPWLGSVVQAECMLPPDHHDFVKQAQKDVEKYGSLEACAIHIASGQCMCGIYTTIERPNWAEEGDVIAECLLWGWVQPATEGYRAQFAEVLSLSLKMEECPVSGVYVKRLEERYGCPVSYEALKHEVLYVSGKAYCACQSGTMRRGFRGPTATCPNKGAIDL